jgi:hypothetical protein
MGKVAKGDGWRKRERLLVNKIFALLSDFGCCLGMFKYWRRDSRERGLASFWVTYV